LISLGLLSVAIAPFSTWQAMNVSEAKGQGRHLNVRRFRVHNFHNIGIKPSTKHSADALPMSRAPSRPKISLKPCRCNIAQDLPGCA
jgi:hypothetical protein